MTQTTEQTTIQPVKPVTARGKRLQAAGYQVVREVRTRKVYGKDWSGRPTLTGPWQTGKWFEVITPHGQAAVVGYQSARIIHVFGVSVWTASGCSESSAHTGGLGDAIGTDGEMRGYERLVMSAPESLTKKYDGLYYASSVAFNERW